MTRDVWICFIRKTFKTCSIKKFKKFTNILNNFRFKNYLFFTNSENK